MYKSDVPVDLCRRTGQGLSFIKTRVEYELKLKAVETQKNLGPQNAEEQ